MSSEVANKALTSTSSHRQAEQQYPLKSDRFTGAPATEPLGRRRRIDRHPTLQLISSPIQILNAEELKEYLAHWTTSADVGEENSSQPCTIQKYLIHEGNQGIDAQCHSQTLSVKYEAPLVLPSKVRRLALEKGFAQKEEDG